jgi:ABC-type uncharacterized transport system substrate-binding protein
VLIALAACLWLLSFPGPADAQEPSPRRIGVLLVLFSPESKEAQAFRQGLRDAGYSEGHDVVIEWRFANGDYDRVSQLATDLVQRKVDVIVTDVEFSARAALRATSTIPIVITMTADPVASGLVTNLAHPGANITGLSLMMPELVTKRLQLLKQAMPQATRVAILWNPATPYHPKAIQELKATAPSLAIELSFVSVRTPEQFDPAFSAASRAHAQALYVLDAPLFFTHRTTLLKLASRARLPAISGAKEFTDEGGLMSYGVKWADHWRRSAWYVDMILKGANPGDLPIEQPTKFELVVNLKTAKALGLTIPASILQRADEVIK